MSSGGMKIGLKGFSPVLDSVFGMRDGSVKQQASADLSTQLLSAGPLANVLAATSGNVVFFATKAAMDLAVDYSAPQAAWVFADPNPANNAVYYFTNGDPGYWSFMLNFPASWIYATVSGGTANEVELSMAGTVSRSTMIFFEVSEDNLGGGVTISVNGSDPMTALDFRGDPLEAGALAEGALAVFFPVGDGTARMIVDNTATAAAAAAAASAASANASALASSDSAVAANASATRSQRFATAPEDEETSPGSGLFSAFHWAQKAMTVVLGDIADQIVAAVAATPSSMDVLPFVNTTTGALKNISLANLITKFKADGDLATKAGAETLLNKTLSEPVLKGEVFRGLSSGGALSNNATDANNDIDIAACSVTSDGATPVVFARPTSITKQLDAAWTVGTNGGGLDTGTKQPNTWYYAFAIQRSDTGVSDVLLSASISAPTMPANYDRKRRLPGAIRTNGSGNIRAFKQRGRRRFEFAARIDDISVSSPGAAEILRSVTVPPSMFGIFEVQLTTADYFEITCPDQPAIAESSSAGTTFVTNGRGGTRLSQSVDSASQIRTKLNAGGGSLYISTIGFEDLEF